MTRRVLVARLDSAGDVLVSGPAVRAVAAAPDVEVTLLCGPQGAAAGRLLPGVDRVLTWAAPWIVDPAPAATPEHVADLAALVAEARPDEAVVLTSFHQSPLPLALLLRLAGVGRITGVSTDYAGSLLDVRLRPGETLDDDQPEPERALGIAAAAGFALPAGDDGRLAVDLDDDARRTAADLVRDVAGDAPYVVVHPGAAVPARAWSPERNAEAVTALAAVGWRVLVTGSSAEAELTRRVAGRDGVDLGSRTDLATMAALLAGAAATVTGNTGPAHLSAAVGTPVVSLFSPVVPAVRWAPYGVPVALLGDQGAACRGTRARECPVAGHPCLTGVSADDVVAALTGLVGRPRRVGSGVDDPARDSRTTAAAGTAAIGTAATGTAPTSTTPSSTAPSSTVEAVR
ncbi:ADP-heptose:LPS heptosyltransferase [Frigoribacterium sp. PvP120]|uniref:glycosyltransferase family 9 protein n=1 Tax=unclassified Frigoribacterium TaxID=2627005 RepID=UPI001B5E70B2|nr:glycosyltransferase family 9 protein [Frigoribacterium sp. PvP121]MBP1240425.1 ADP-heptose:LPS heptosyltransferase [Frigoribacterium sp. PvP121]